MKYQEWLIEWLENYVKPTSKLKTYTRYKEIIEQHICPHLGTFEMEMLTPIVIQKFVTELLEKGNLRTGKGLSSNSVNSIITVIQGSLETAYNLNLTNQSIADKIKRPKITEKQVSCFTPVEQKKSNKRLCK